MQLNTQFPHKVKLNQKKGEAEDRKLLAFSSSFHLFTKNKNKHGYSEKNNQDVKLRAKQRKYMSPFSRLADMR